MLWLLLACAADPQEPWLGGGGTLVGDTADPDRDTDGDGVTDEQERADGTDPADPTSASAWQPDLSARPRLLVDDTTLLRERLASADEPWVTLAARLAATCAGDLDEPTDNLSHLNDWTNTALACAVLYVGGDADAGGRAAEILESLPTSCDDPHTYADKTDLYGGHGILQGSRAWDLLVGAGYPTGHDPALAAQQLHALGEFLWDFWVVDWPEYMLLFQNNHNTKLASAFGALGMGVHEDPRSARYVAWAGSELPRLHEGLLALDGGYAEGPSYLVYAMQSELPWLGALDRWLGEGKLSAWSFCRHSFDADCVEGPVEVPSPLRADERICAAFDRFAETLMPGGTSPNTDDANLAKAHLGLTAAWCASGLQAWGWDRQASAFLSTGSVDLTADTLAWADPALAPVEPDAAPLAREAAGYALLRTGLGQDDAYALLLAESGVARSGGRGHEHPDALAVLWAAGGEYLLIDSGYGHYEVHDEVMKARAHNLVLVDDLDSTTTDATLGPVETLAPGVQVARASVTLGGVDWSRAVVLAGDTALVVYDRLVPTDGAEHDYMLAWHAPSTALEAGEVATWTLAGGPLSLATRCTADMEWTQRAGEHGFSAELEEHAVLYASTRAEGPDCVTVALAPSAETDLTSSASVLSWASGSAAPDGSLVLGETTWQAW